MSTAKQEERLRMIREEGYDTKVNPITEKLITVVITKDHGSIWNNEHFHLLIGPLGRMQMIRCGHIDASGDPKHEKVLTRLFYSKCFGRTNAGTFKAPWRKREKR